MSEERYCVFCKHHRHAGRPQYDMFEHVCHHPSQGRDRVTGEPVTLLCELMRSYPRQCGSSGQLWEPK